MLSPALTANHTMDSRLRLGRCTIYAIMGAELHGINWLNPNISLHIYKIFVLPRILYGLEAIDFNPANTARLEMAHKAMISNIQGLPNRTAIPALYLLSGMLSMEALIDRSRLCMIPQMARNPTLYDIIHRQIAVKDHKSNYNVLYNSWVIEMQSILQKYSLSYLVDLIRSRFSKESRKRWLMKLSYDNGRCKLRRRPSTKHQHPSWTSRTQTSLTYCGTRQRQTQGTSAEPASMLRCWLVCTYYKRIGRPSSRLVTLCKDREEDMMYFLTSCRHTIDDRDPWLKAALSHIPLVFKDHPHNWSVQELAHLVLEPSHPTVEEKLHLHRDTIHLIEKETRLMLHSP